MSMAWRKLNPDRRELDMITRASPIWELNLARRRVLAFLIQNIEKSIADRPNSMPW